MKVGAMMLTADRQKYTERAMRCFFRQTYSNCCLVILDTGDKPYELYKLTPEQSKRVVVMRMQRKPSDTIGSLRNVAAAAMVNCDAIIHWDDDDYSGPDRIQDSVRELTDPRVKPQAVGYCSGIFADRRSTTPQAWWYQSQEQNYCLGSSLMYWRRTWEAQKFPSTSQGEDTAWARNLRKTSVSAAYNMIFDIHTGNTSTAYDPKLMATAKEWKRSPEYDSTIKLVGLAL